MAIDFLIIGQGLAGSLLGWELIQRGCRVLVVDKGQENASMVSAGIINPITGMRFVKTADLDTLLPAAQRYYSQLAAYFGQPFYVPKTMFRLLRTKTERTKAESRLSQNDYTPYLGRLYDTDRELAPFSAAYGYLEQDQTGYLLTASLLACLQKFFIARQSYQLNTVSYHSFEPDSILSWNGLKVKHAIFCEGYEAKANPWFSWLPFRSAKGETLTLLHATSLPNAMINFGYWVLPINLGEVRIGATFDHYYDDKEPSAAGKSLLLAALLNVNPSLVKASISEHQAGIRPCTADRFPFVGRHPKYPQISIFNGFGAKGSLQIPWYCSRFADHLLNQQPLPVSCDIQRFQTTHFPG